MPAEDNRSAWPSSTNACSSLGDYAKVIEYHEHHLAIAKVGGGGQGVREPRDCLQVAGDFSKAIKYHGQHLAIA